MIEASDFLNLLKQRGYNVLTGVPCSYLTELINLALDDPEIEYIAATNEGDAVAIAAGAYLGGGKAAVFMQNSGFGNAINPMTSLLQPFEIPILFLITHRGDPDQSPDQPQHKQMGALTLSLLSQLGIDYAELNKDEPRLSDVVNAGIDCVESTNQSFAFVIKKGCFDNKSKLLNKVCYVPSRPFAMNLKSPVAQMPSMPIYKRGQVLQRVQALFKGSDDIILTTTGYTGRELYSLGDRSNQLYMVGSMGCIASLGLGLALARPDLRVIVIDGDGAALMRMGAMATIGHYKPDNMLHILLDNDAYESTGGQITVSSSVDFPGVALACGYPAVMADAHYETSFAQWREGLRFVYIKTELNLETHDYPRPRVTPAEVADRLRQLVCTYEDMPL